MRGYIDSDIHNESTGETMGQYWKRKQLEELKPVIEWGICILAGILIIVLSLTAF